MNCNAKLTVTNTDGKDQIVGYLNANIDAANLNLNISTSISDADLANANTASVQAQYTSFETAVKERSKEILGYAVFGATTESTTTTTAQ